MPTRSLAHGPRTAVADEMEAGRRHERGQLHEELLRREDDLRRAAAPASLQAMEQTAVLEA
jgi:hypothetical protein